MATPFEPFLMAVELVIESARLDRETVLAALPKLHAAHACGDIRALNRALRELTPTEVWSWPAYEEWFAVTQQKRNTRLKMVEALTNLIYRRCTLAERHKQALEGRARNPLWEFMVAGDGMDWPDCRSRSGFQAAWDDPRWRHEMLAPFFCKRVGCRCSIRAHSVREIARQAASRVEDAT